MNGSEVTYGAFGMLVVDQRHASTAAILDGGVSGFSSQKIDPVQATLSAVGKMQIDRYCQRVALDNK